MTESWFYTWFRVRYTYRTSDTLMVPRLLPHSILKTELPTVLRNDAFRENCYAIPHKSCFGANFIESISFSKFAEKRMFLW